MPSVVQDGFIFSTDNPTSLEITESLANHSENRQSVCNTLIKRAVFVKHTQKTEHKDLYYKMVSDKNVDNSTALPSKIAVSPRETVIPRDKKYKSGDCEQTQGREDILQSSGLVCGSSPCTG